MNHATTPKGDMLIVLTPQEYETLRGDAALAAAAQAARSRDTAAPRMPADLAQAMIDGTLHPLTAWRQAAGLTQGALAERAGLRLSTVSDIERGKIDPRLSTLRALANALGTDIDDIV
ncbi:helix-turn-helix transcriptional regulator [Tabrizicola sp. TH137]|uniref:helix-turn-helix domain-containing protein n=1 Tax=Tabrizicola sp. TH137 TaxID=2067452 RepID=UPI001C1FFA38|nr:helix-turn-helix transcriptional regulator [Tabrizicola sp. TH137]